MKQEDKQLLLVDLSVRLPYGVKVQVTQVPIGLSKDETLTYNRMYSLDESDEYITIKPYLRPMSSMTEKEKKQFDKFICIDEDAWIGKGIEGYINQSIIMSDGIDYLNKNHFDFRGLIPKSLAIEVTKENNPYKTLKL